MKTISSISATQDLLRAAMDGELLRVKIALNRGADIHYFQDFALRHAVNQGHLDVVKFLIENGADVHAKGELALEWAINSKNIETVKFLIESGAKWENLPEYSAIETKEQFLKFMELLLL